jgi:hypothetical protein
MVFNNAKYSVIEISDSAEKHFSNDSMVFYGYITKYLDGQNWKAAEFGKDGHPEYITASATSAIKHIYAQSDYRETCFRTYPEEEKILFFHGCSIKKKQYLARISHTPSISLAKIELR